MEKGWKLADEIRVEQVHTHLCISSIAKGGRCGRKQRAVVAGRKVPRPFPALLIVTGGQTRRGYRRREEESEKLPRIPKDAQVVVQKLEGRDQATKQASERLDPSLSISEPTLR